MKKVLKQIWNNKKQIIEGITNSVFTKQTIEDVAQTRLSICRECECYDIQGMGCAVSGTQPCCNQLLGGCGCSLYFKVRSLSSDCPKLKWRAVMSQDEEDKLNT